MLVCSKLIHPLERIVGSKNSVKRDYIWYTALWWLVVNSVRQWGLQRVLDVATRISLYELALYYAVVINGHSAYYNTASVINFRLNKPSAFYVEMPRKYSRRPLNGRSELKG